MAGSSGHALRAGRLPSGMVSRAQLARWGLEHVRFRLRGSTDARTAEVLVTGQGAPGGRARARHRAHGARTCWRASCRASTRRCSRRSARTRTPAARRSSSAPPGNGLVEILARVLGMDGGIGTRYEVDADGLLTGQDRGAVRVRRGQGRGDASASPPSTTSTSAASWAYSDSASDLPMLRAVGNPVAVNPDAELARVAAEEGWRVMRFEKLGRRLAIAGATVVAAAARRRWARCSRRRRAAPPRRVGALARSASRRRRLGAI